jgi:HSP20 family protein
MSDNEQAVAERSTVETADVVSGAVYTPGIDLREEPDGVELVADLPGVSPDSLNVSVENQVLTIEGRAAWDPPDGYSPVVREFEPGLFRRVLRLSDRLVPDGIAAQLKQGVLHLKIPRREALKPRKIAISTK